MATKKKAAKPAAKKVVKPVKKAAPAKKTAPAKKPAAKKAVVKSLWLKNQSLSQWLKNQ